MQSRILILLFVCSCLFSCSQKQFAFREKVNVRSGVSHTPATVKTEKINPPEILYAEHQPAKTVTPTISLNDLKSFRETFFEKQQLAASVQNIQAVNKVEPNDTTTTAAKIAEYGLPIASLALSIFASFLMYDILQNGGELLIPILLLLIATFVADYSYRKSKGKLISGFAATLATICLVAAGILLGLVVVSGILFAIFGL